jgi:hypothetical protein
VVFFLSSLFRDGQLVLFPAIRYLKLLMAALNKIPASAKTLYRGVKKSLSELSQKFDKGKMVVWWAVTSTASHVSVLENEQFLGKSGSRCLFTINAVSARDIQRYSAMSATECEFVLMPGCCLVVEDILDVGSGLTIVQLAEDLSTQLLKFPSSGAAGASTLKHSIAQPHTHSSAHKHASAPAHVQASAALPHGWEVLVDQFGQLYYGNPQLKHTQYQHPSQGIVHPPLPSGWEILADQNGQQFYRNAQLNISQYQHPSTMGICQSPQGAFALSQYSPPTHAPSHSTKTHPHQPKTDPPKKEGGSGAAAAGVAALLLF